MNKIDSEEEENREMLDLNDSPAQTPTVEKDAENSAAAATANDNSSSSAVADEAEDDDNKIFGFSIREESTVVTRQLFPVDKMVETVRHAEDAGCSSLQQAHWVGVQFRQSSVTGKTLEVVQSTKKSRRGPRSRSSQYRGVTFYRRTGRWESHIWFDSQPHPWLWLYMVLRNLD